MATIPENFDIASAASDFARPGWRTAVHDIAKQSHVARGHRVRYQLYIEVGSWTFSAVWGTGTYCTGARPGGEIMDCPSSVSPDAEIAVWNGTGPMIDLHGDKVEGWVRPASLIAAAEAAKADDIDGIRAALVRSE